MKKKSLLHFWDISSYEASSLDVTLCLPIFRFVHSKAKCADDDISMKRNFALARSTISTRDQDICNKAIICSSVMQVSHLTNIRAGLINSAEAPNVTIATFTGIDSGTHTLSSTQINLETLIFSPGVYRKTKKGLPRSNSNLETFRVAIYDGRSTSETDKSYSKSFC